MFGRNFAGRGMGMGFGFRGSSTPWPYIGRGRGGLPRCGYYFRGIAPTNVVPPETTGLGDKTSPASMSRDEELGYLKNRAEAIKNRLDEIESRMQELKTE